MSSGETGQVPGRNVHEELLNKQNIKHLGNLLKLNSKKLEN